MPLSWTGANAKQPSYLLQSSKHVFHQLLGRSASWSVDAAGWKSERMAGSEVYIATDCPSSHCELMTNLT